jgi:RHS repeat-associated protein
MKGSNYIYNDFSHTTVCSVWDKGYRFGFNGKEIDKGSEGMGGGGSSYDYGFRIYNPSLGKFLSVDPLTASYPFFSTYQFASNNPIVAIDLDGLEAVVVITAVIGGKYKDKKGRQFFMYQVNIYENITYDEYLEKYKNNTLGPPTSTTLVSRDAWSDYEGRSKKRYGSGNETPPGKYFMTYNAHGYGSKLHQVKISDTKNGDFIEGPDGRREGVRWHQYTPYDAVGCFTTGKNNKTSIKESLLDKVPSLTSGKEVVLIVEDREAWYNDNQDVFVGSGNYKDPITNTGVLTSTSGSGMGGMHLNDLSSSEFSVE